MLHLVTVIFSDTPYKSPLWTEVIYISAVNKTDPESEYKGGGKSCSLFATGQCKYRQSTH